MKRDWIIKLMNWIALLCIVGLVYWVFVFAAIEIFEFKIFRENMTEAFYLSVFGIMALLFGAVVVSVMFNLTKISSAIGGEIDAGRPSRGVVIKVVLMGVSFPLIFGLLYLGDHATANKREARIKDAAAQLVAENEKSFAELTDYSFTAEWRQGTAATIQLLSRMDEDFPHVSLIVPDKIDEKAVLLSFSTYYNRKNDKADYVYSCSAEERAYLSKAFGGDLSSRFSNDGSRYELYYPISMDGKVVVLYLSEYQYYGKSGY